jgi:NADPH:quinone reductase-like Zn-dependent oxidoreductase
MIQGLLVSSFPIVLGCDASGVVVEVGEEASPFKVGDRVCGCTRLGEPGYGTFQEYVRFPGKGHRLGREDD